MRWMAAVLLLVLAGCTTAGPGPSCGPGERAMVDETLHFGTAIPSGGQVGAAEWTDFLAREVTPRFPQGLTVWPASGQWQGADKAVVREGSYVLNLLRADDAAADDSVRAIAQAYKQRFRQDAVMRVRAPACVSF
jgi:hypothetical protein